MSDRVPARWFTLVRRELQEYRVSLVLTPLVVAGALAVLLLAGVLVANQFSNLGNVMLQAVMQEESSGGPGFNIRVIVNDNGKPVTEVLSETFTPAPPASRAADDNGTAPVDSLNPLLHGVHLFMLVILVFVSFNYLLGCLYTDRKDRSILFWRSLPVSARDEVLAKLAVALLVAPGIFIAASLLVQLATVLLAMLLVLRMDLDPFAVVLGNVQFGRLLLDQFGGWVLNALWVLPVYAWVMLASAAARRSPFLLAVTPVLGLLVLEAILLGSNHFGTAIMNHMPQHTSDSSAAGFHLLGPDWANLDYLGLVLGLLVAGVLLAATVWLRRYRWEI